MRRAATRVFWTAGVECSSMRAVWGSSRERRARRSVACLLALLSFVLHFGLALDFERVGALSHGDWLFDADPQSRLQTFSENLHLGIKHPNLMPYFSPALRVAAKVLVLVAPHGSEE